MTAETLPPEICDALSDFAREVENTMGWDSGQATWENRDAAHSALVSAILAYGREARAQGREEIAQRCEREAHTVDLGARFPDGPLAGASVFNAYKNAAHVIRALSPAPWTEHVERIVLSEKEAAKMDEMLTEAKACDELTAEAQRLGMDYPSAPAAEERSDPWCTRGFNDVCACETCAPAAEEHAPRGTCGECRQTVALEHDAEGWPKLARHPAECFGSGCIPAAEEEHGSRDENRLRHAFRPGLDRCSDPLTFIGGAPAAPPTTPAPCKRCDGEGEIAPAPFERTTCPDCRGTKAAAPPTTPAPTNSSNEEG